MIDPALAKAIARVESNDSLSAIRFEPEVYERLVAGAYGGSIPGTMTWNKCNRATAHMIRATSWGKYQIMGFNLYANPPMQLSIAEFLASPEAQDEQFARFLAGCGMAEVTLASLVSNPVTRQTFITHYNGPDAVDYYWSRMVAAGFGASQ